MVYRYNISLDHRFRKMMMFLGGVGLLLVTSVVVAFSRGSIGPAIVLLLIGFYGAFRFRKMLKSHSSSYLETFDDHITVQTPTGEKVHINYSDLTFYGLARYPDNSSYLYGYAESEDRFFALPDSFTSLESLLEELSEHGVRHDVELNDKELFSDGLRRSLGEMLSGPAENEHSSEDAK
ncbi:MAG: hypothetical protein ACOC4I_02455 [Spirochaetota bacterium]